MSGRQEQHPPAAPTPLTEVIILCLEVVLAMLVGDK